MKNAINPSILIATLATITLPALAEPITMVHQGNGTGRVGQLSFENANFTITTQADTADRIDLGFGWALQHTIATIEIEGLGSYDFITETRTFINDFNNTVGFSINDGFDLFNGPINDINLSNWDMTTSIGPVSGDGVLYTSWDTFNINSTGGIIFFRSDANTTATFSATVVPTPTALTLLTLTTLTATRRRRTKITL